MVQSGRTFSQKTTHKSLYVTCAESINLESIVVRAGEMGEWGVTMNGHRILTSTQGNTTNAL